ncbi:MAG: hypothetical protein A2Y62_16325 [Candidatus Fischerbacteria bacterium RBG_13_37_8]|uniref:Cyclic dehypoxanthine futalosine synthase n=1 Tax=Candidatus Fischerbacteria bacterium RBG_13_37_8 TaxID=1817863 RepID=A0A1F5VVP8_9BACT|nr:MAG: hypothetical protein A2Y62_16325 [Candidatus Fischerbacteria bacterium RBG_13_37_8]
MIEERIKAKIEKGERIAEHDALELFQSDDILMIGRLAQAARGLRKADRVVSYVLYRNINYTNVCISMCSFCAFSRNMKDSDAYVLTTEEIREKIRAAMVVGTNAILLQGGLHPDCKIDFFIELLKTIKDEFPDMHIHAFSPPEILHIARNSNIAVEGIIELFKDAGLSSIPGGGAEILVDEIRREVSPLKCTASEWLMVMEKAHMQGVKSSATMMFGGIENYTDRIMHLSLLRELQDRTKGFTAFIPWTYQPNREERHRGTEAQRHKVGNNELLFETDPLDLKMKEEAKISTCRRLREMEHANQGITETSAVDYLKTLAIARIYLDNFIHIEASLVTQGPKIAQLALEFGADDIGSIMMEENVVRAAGNSYIATEAELIYLIKEAGYIPAKRDVLYNQYTMV